MGREIKKWPTYALDKLEAVLYKAKQIDRMGHDAQEALDKSHYLKAALLTSDIRALAMDIIEDMRQARSGQYDKEM